MKRTQCDEFNELDKHTVPIAKTIISQYLTEGLPCLFSTHYDYPDSPFNNRLSQYKLTFRDFRDNRYYICMHFYAPEFITPASRGLFYRVNQENNSIEIYDARSKKHNGRFSNPKKFLIPENMMKSIYDTLTTNQSISILRERINYYWNINSVQQMRQISVKQTQTKKQTGNVAQKAQAAQKVQQTQAAQKVQQTQAAQKVQQTQAAQKVQKVNTVECSGHSCSPLFKQLFNWRGKKEEVVPQPSRPPPRG
jgi:hypothetical protein